MRKEEQQTFQFHDTNSRSKNKEPAHQPNNQQLKPRHIIISEAPGLSLNLEELNSRVHVCFEERIMTDNVKKAVKNTFQKRGVTKEGQFKLQSAIEDSQSLAKNYMDKMEAVLNDSMLQNQALHQFQEQKNEKTLKRQAKLSSIFNLVEKIAEKLRERKLESIVENFRGQMQDCKVKIPQNIEYQRTMTRLPLLKQRLVELKNTRKENSDHDIY